MRFSFGANSHKLAATLEWKSPEFSGLSTTSVRHTLGLEDKGDLKVERGEALYRKVPRVVRRLSLVRVFWAYEALLAMVLQQRVSWQEAATNWSSLCKRHGESWGNLTSPPSPRKLLSLSDPDFAACGIESNRSLPCREAARLLAVCPDMTTSAEELDKRLAMGKRLGPWTRSYFLGLAWADPDAVPLGDYDLPHLVSYVFENKRRGSDTRMLELLESFAPQRFRVLRWLLASGIRVPRRGPRMEFGQGLG